MPEYKMMSKQELLSEQEALLKRFDEYKAMGLKLDMSRGKPSKEQLDLSMDMLKPIDYTENGFDVRNYGILDGLQSCKELFAQLLDVDAKNVLVGPAASLNPITPCTTEYSSLTICLSTHGMDSVPVLSSSSSIRVTTFAA